MTPSEILILHRERICYLFTEMKSWPKVFEQLSTELPNPIGMQLGTFKQYAPILLELTKELNKKLNNAELNNAVKQELEQVKQQLNTLQELNSQLNNQLELNNPVKQSRVKQGLNIGGWTIQQSGGYYRAFKKVNGKMFAVYIGKNLDDAAAKIEAKAALLRSLTHTDTCTT